MLGSMTLCLLSIRVGCVCLFCEIQCVLRAEIQEASVGSDENGIPLEFWMLYDSGPPVHGSTRQSARCLGSKTPIKRRIIAVTLVGEVNGSYRACVRLHRALVHVTMYVHVLVDHLAHRAPHCVREPCRPVYYTICHVFCILFHYILLQILLSFNSGEAKEKFLIHSGRDLDVVCAALAVVILMRNLCSRVARLCISNPYLYAYQLSHTGVRIFAKVCLSITFTMVI